MAFSRLGFIVTPYSVHGDRDPKTGEIIPQGSANRLVMLETGYLEFLTVVDGTDTPVSRHLEDRMDKYIGVHLVAFTVADAEAEAQRIAEEGIDLQPTVNLRRSIEAEDGSDVEVAFSVVRARFDLFPEGRVQTLTHHTPEHVWQDRYIARDNGIAGLGDIIYASENPAESAARLAKFTGRSQVNSELGVSIQLDRGKLTFAKRQDLQETLGLEAPRHSPSIAAIGLVSRDVALTERYLETHGIGFDRMENIGLLIKPSEALGAALLIYKKY